MSWTGASPRSSRTSSSSPSSLFFFNDTATTEIYTLSLHDALPIIDVMAYRILGPRHVKLARNNAEDRKSTRLNSSHDQISYAVFCLTKKKRYQHSLILQKKTSYHKLSRYV